MLTSACLLFALFCNPAEADIVLTIDTDTETWSLSGSDTGDPEKFFNPNSSSDSSVRWEITFDQANSPFFSSQFPAATSSIPNSFSFAFLGEETSINQTSYNFYLEFEGFPTDVTITPIGGPISYAGVSPESKAWFESLIGGTIPVTLGSNFNPISVQGAQGVPEPSSLAVLFGIAVVGISRRRGA